MSAAAMKRLLPLAALLLMSGACGNDDPKPSDQPDASVILDGGDEHDAGPPPSDGGIDAGVEDGGTDVDAGPDPHAADNLTERASTAICGALFRCCDRASRDAYFLQFTGNTLLADFLDRLPPNAEVTAEQCPGLIKEMFDIVPFGRWVSAVQGEWVGYDQAAVDACVATLGQAACGEQLGRALYDSTCFGFQPPAGGIEQRSMFVRSAQPEASCVTLNDGIGAKFYGTCDPNTAFCCFTDEQGNCSFPKDGVGTCVAASDHGEQCSFIPPMQLCRTGAACDLDDATCHAEGQGPLQEGDLCVDTLGYALGNCQNSWCDFDSSFMCEPLRDVGDPCGFGGMCNTYECVDGRCAEPSFCIGPNPCDGISTCSDEGLACEANLLVTCAADDQGCLQRSETDCAADGNVCLLVQGTPTCVNPCAGVECNTPPASSCDGQVAVNAAATGTCNNGVCTYDETRTDCAAQSKVCQLDAGTATCVDLCAGVDCNTPPAASCDGQVAVNPAATGTCAAGECTYAETRTDCAAQNERCELDAGTATCVVVDPCAGKQLCSTVGTSCSGDVLTSCAYDSDNCLVETTQNCAAAAGGLCETDANGSRCSIDPCEGFACDSPPADFCQGDALMGYAATGTCSVQNGQPECAYQPSATTCPNNQVCRVGANGAACTDPCAGKTLCTTAGTTCSNNALVTCAADADGCLVETSVNCGSQTCDATSGTCQNTLCPAATPINCATGTISGDTAQGTSQISKYSCFQYNTMGKKEVIYAFSNPIGADVKIKATRTSSVTGTFPLIVLDGDSQPCTDPTSGTRTCLDNTLGMASTETDTVDFTVLPGQVRYVILDSSNYNSPNYDTTTFNLQVSCVQAICGDGTIASGEACDDGDTDNGDGCSAGCQIETGYVCSGTPSVCTQVQCGDGRVEGSEACDDGDTDNGDGCSSTCAVESGYRCNGQPSVCFAGGENCSDPITLSAGTYQFDTTGFVSDFNDYGGMCGYSYGGGAGADMSFVAHVPANSMLRVTATGANGFSPRLAMATSCAGIVPSCQRLVDSGKTATWFNGNATTQDIYFVVDAYGATEKGAYSLAVETIPVASLQAGDTCQNAIRLNGPGQVSGNNNTFNNAYDGYTGACASAYQTYRPGKAGDVVYVISVPAGKTLTATVTASGGWDDVVAISPSCSDLLNACGAYSDASPATTSVTNNGAAAVDYYIVADGFSDYAKGAYTLTTTLQ